ncbi:MAG: amidohydrolase family protein [Pseudomonadales bacterium]|jgi:L-fuconolactonase|nr:amidohydrolase family protein [Pseudomonadales bacterium]
MRAEWLARVQEDIIEPDLPICDPHHHLWDNETNPYLLPQLLGDINSGHNVTSTVFVECSSMYRVAGPESMRPVGETEFVNGVAAMTASGDYGDFRACEGIVSFADFTLGPEVGPVLDEHIRLSDRFRGIRHAAGWDASDRIRNSHTHPPQSLFLREDFQAGFQELANRDLTFDAWLYHPQISDVTTLAKMFPDTTIIFDHFGGPLGIGPYANQGDLVFEEWAASVAELAKCTNVYPKLGGIVMPLNGFGWHKQERPATSDELVAATGRYHLKTIDLFGPERCMFESNFPVDQQSCSYHVLWNAFKKLAAEFSAADKQWLFHDTARHAYKLAAA